MKISARNKILGKIKALEDKGLIFVIRVQPIESAIITAVITREAAEQMKIKKNDLVKVVVKPTEVMIKNKD
ncbi:MAG: TOBE domain-containing protein [Candidatus Helarchaeota archaeon]|nr:TOBE domain-containing protein [Candidatus Helarchaeota archaeon]